MRPPPVGAAGAGREAGQGIGSQAQLTAPGEHRAYLVGEAARGQTGTQFVGPLVARQPVRLKVDLARQEFAYGDVLLGT